MKNINSFQQSKLSAGVVLLLLFATSCTKTEDPKAETPQEQTMAMLTSGTWKLQSESADGVDQTALYKDLTIKFTSSSFTATNGHVIWPNYGTWNFDGTTTNIRREDGITVIIAVNESTLTMSLNWTKTTLGSGKLNSSSGENVFTMVK